MSQITTHVLDTSRGLPAANLSISLLQSVDGQWQPMVSGRTDSDGRISDLLLQDQVLAAGDYKMSFDTGGYFDALNETGFYPLVDIVFTINHADGQHYHIPLLLSAYGYSTYRGS
ncbi:MAG: hydroxyisourate hydrolase [Pseudomonadales bacterium]|nr:hydroxyisourate hydrolase [Pseudomonadales bacterium]